MPTPRDNAIWSNIRVQLSDTQRYLLEGQYREAVLGSRELLKALVRMQMNDACLVSTELGMDIEQLFENRVIGAVQRENYQRVNSAAEQAAGAIQPDAQMANDVFSLIRQELSDYVEQEQRGRDAESRSEAATAQEPELTVSRRYSTDNTAGIRDAGPSIPLSRRTESEPQRERVRRSSTRRSSGRSTGGARRSGARRSTGRDTQRSGRRNRYREEQVQELDLYSILKIAVPLLILILVVILLRVLSGGGKNVAETTPATSAVETTISTEPETTVPETTVPETTEAPRRWITTDGLRVRTRPSTENSEVLTVLEPGTELNYKGEYDADWLIIDYNGQEAYVAKAYVRSEAL